MLSLGHFVQYGIFVQSDAYSCSVFIYLPFYLLFSSSSKLCYICRKNSWSHFSGGEFDTLSGRRANESTERTRRFVSYLLTIYTVNAPVNFIVFSYLVELTDFCGTYVFL